MRILLLTLGLLLAACTAGNAPRYLIDAGADGDLVRIVPGSVEVRDVSLPAYASASEIVAQGEDGALYEQGDALWADDPVRGVTGALVRAVGSRTSADIAAEPWPLADRPDVTIDVRVDDMFAGADGIFILRGQFALSSPDRVLRETVRRFDIATPVAGQGTEAITRAQASALSRLADEIIASMR
ncbi:membrane integrity-associated transporter subunit PqiC [Thalassococcus sp. S3]|uniref:PqiC family protein n=1 Tax=Thalassococcus sp. S3 TaxID=2017482 RepID=UPI0020C51B0D|nr:PqiC family protein [Thalassococcus sp. S3]